MVTLITDESNWLTVSMSLALLAVFVLLKRYSGSLPLRARVLAGMNLFFGVTIGTMAFGHLLAVTTKFLTGTLVGSALFLYPVGIALAVPSWWLILHTWRTAVSGDGPGRAAAGLNGWVVVTLIALGLYNLPLAAPGVFNIGYSLHSRRVVGWTILALAVALHTSLFIGSMIFLASGQNFEQFMGIQ